MKAIFALAMICFSSLSFGNETVAQCAVNDVKGSNGVRINLLKTPTDYKANLIFGTTVSGTAYHLVETSPGVFVGSIKNKPKYTMTLKISTKAVANQYINGYVSSLTAVFPDLRVAAGFDSVTTKASDKFVCGKKVSNF